MPMGEVPHHDDLAPAATPGDAQLVALAQQPAGPRHPFTSTLPPWHAVRASERVLKRQATSSHTSSRCEAEGRSTQRFPSLDRDLPMA